MSSSDAEKNVSVQIVSHWPAESVVSTAYIAVALTVRLAHRNTVLDKGLNKQ